MKTVRFILMTFLYAAALVILFFAAIILSTNRYGGWMPPGAMVVGAVAAVSLAVVMMIRRSGMWLVVGLFALSAIFFVYRRETAKQRMNRASVSCSNHAMYISGRFWQMVEARCTETNMFLPATTEFYDLEMMLQTNGYIRTPEKCGGYKLSKLKTGYVYVGGGLSLATVAEKSPLIAFCAAECHPPPYDWDQHAMCPDFTCANTEKLVGMLRKAIEKAETGEIPYSPEAVAIMKEEIRKRNR